MDKLRNERYCMATPDEVAKAVEEIRGYIAQYDWGGRIVSPYGYGVKLDDFMKHFDDYEEYTRDSQAVMLDELNGLIMIYVNKWLKKEHEPKVSVRLANGRVRELPESTANDFVEMGLAVII